MEQKMHLRRLTIKFFCTFVKYFTFHKKRPTALLKKEDEMRHILNAFTIMIIMLSLVVTPGFCAGNGKGNNGNNDKQAQAKNNNGNNGNNSNQSQAKNNNGNNSKHAQTKNNNGNNGQAQNKSAWTSHLTS